MNKFYNHIFCKIGLLISSCVIDFSQMKIDAHEAPDAIASVWPIDSSNALHNILSKDDILRNTDSNIFHPSASLPENQKKTISWNSMTSTEEKPPQEVLTRPLVFFTLKNEESDSSVLPEETSNKKQEQEKHITAYQQVEPPALPTLTQNEPDPVIKTIEPNRNEHEKISVPSSVIETPVTPPPPEKPRLIALDTPENLNSYTPKKANVPGRTILINFNNVGIIEFIRFISRVSNKNFVFDEADLQFNVTIVSEEPTTIENIMTALLQELRIHGLTLIEQGNNLIIHKNPKVNSVSKVVAEDLPGSSAGSSEIITQVFRLNTLEPDRAAAIIRPLVSENAILEFIKDTNHLIVTDLQSNIVEIGKLIKSLDAPNSGLVIGQYVAKSTNVESLVPLVQQIMLPISKDSPLVYVPYPVSQSIFIVSTPFLVERSMSILEHLDQETGKTRIFELEKMQFEKAKPHAEKTQNAHEQTDEERRFLEELKALQQSQSQETEGQNTQKEPSLTDQQLIDNKAKELAKTLCPVLPPPPRKVGITDFEEEIPVRNEKILKGIDTNENYVPVPVSKAKFYIHKIQYRNGTNLLTQINQIATSLQNTTGNEELLGVISTAQFLQDSKALVFTGTPEYLEKVKALIEELDIPLRQVYIEMLILNTSVDDALEFGVNWSTEFGGGHQAGAQGFSSDLSLLPGAITSATTNNLGSIIPNVATATPFNNAIAPNASQFLSTPGFNLGVIGQHIVHKALGLEFSNIGALVRALHRNNVTDIILSPKIITEDNVPAQVFVGITTPFQTQSIANENGNIITNNIEYRDVGTSLQVTPHIFNSDMVTLEIIQERSQLANVPGSSGNSNTVTAPTTSKTSTKTTIHVPNKFFVIISGMIETNLSKNKLKVPCLGSMPIVGAAFSDKRDTIAKRNLMIFIRPIIIDTDEEFQNLTRHQQDIWKFSGEMPKDWVEEVEGALEYLNVRPTMNTDDQDLPQCHRYSN